MKNKSLKIAVTGGIGSGKSTFCAHISSKGFPLLKADDISKEILSIDDEVKKKITKTFGDESYKAGKPNKIYLAEKVFSNPQNVVKINSILHPKVIKKTEELLKELSKNNKLIFVEAALIYEADMEDLFDYVVLVTADKNIRMQRKTKIDNFSEKTFIERNNNQIPDEEKKKRADFIFENNSSLEQLKSKADLLIMMLKGLLK
jgi:dephospho-CoA kinase